MKYNAPKDLSDLFGRRFSGLFSNFEVCEKAEGETSEDGRPYWRFTIYYMPAEAEYLHYVVGATLEEVVERLENNAYKTCQYEEQ